MNSTINFGIDLGTSNSLIAKYDNGQVHIYKNPTDHKESVASAVFFKKDRIFVGSKALEYARSNSQRAAWRFKRKMGTSEVFRIEGQPHPKSPIELSAIVLRQLKDFVQVHGGEAVEKAVITIPASFDMLQANATKEAGTKAGFKQVVLLQEPIAASLAYANQTGNELKNSRWLVYDLGGGTFDVALVEIVESEIKVLDHSGNNFLGGSDLDSLIVEKLIIPQIEAQASVENFESELKSLTGSYHWAYLNLLHLAEGARIELSTQLSSEIDLGEIHNFRDIDGELIDNVVTITRSEYESILQPEVDETIQSIKTLLTKNGLRCSDLEFVLMVGGMTYTPFVRQRVGELLTLPVVTDIDPTTAIAVGAAYFAGTKEYQHQETSKSVTVAELQVKLLYNRTSQESDEMLSGKVHIPGKGHTYQIKRNDGGYDTGLKPLTERISDDLPLVENAYNTFQFRIFDSQGNEIPTSSPVITIAHGKYSVTGQPLPEDCSLVLDGGNGSNAESELVCDLIFPRNTILPARAVWIRQASKSIVKGSTEAITICIVEGPHEFSPESNQEIGSLCIRGVDLISDIYKNDDIQLKFNMSESRELTVCAFIERTGQEFEQVFESIGMRTVDLNVLELQIQNLRSRVHNASATADGSQKQEFESLQETMRELEGAVESLDLDDSTDERYKLETQKREVSKTVESLTASSRLQDCKEQYQIAKTEAEELIDESGSDLEKQRLREILAQEYVFLRSENIARISLQTGELRGIIYRILFRTPEFLINTFEDMCSRREQFNDQLQATSLIQSGKQAMEHENYDHLREIIFRLFDLLPNNKKTSKDVNLIGIMSQG